MEDVLQRAFAIIIAVVVFFLLPLYIAFEKKDDISYSMALRITSNFVDNVTNKGYISKKMYLDYVTNLAFTNNDYDVTILHTAKKYYPTIYAKVVSGTNTTTKEYDYSTYSEKYGKYIDNESVTIDAITYKQGTNNTLELNYKLIEIQHTDKEILGNCEGDINTIGRTYRIDDDYVYPMSKGDEFTVVIKNTNTTIASILFNTLTMGINDGNDTKVYINYGGSIQNESYRKNAIIGESSTVEETNTEEESQIVLGKTKADIVMRIDHPTGTKYGDVNDNGVVNEEDYTLISNYYSGGNVLGFNKYAADLNFNGSIDVKDVEIMGKNVNNEYESALATKNSVVSLYLKVDEKLGDNYNHKISEKLNVINGLVQSITYFGKNNDYYIYKIQVKINDSVDKVVVNINEGLESANGTKYQALSRIVSVEPVAEIPTTLGCVVTADKEGSTINPTDVVTYTIKFDRAVSGFSISDLDMNGSPVDGGLKGDLDTYTLRLIVMGGSGNKQWVQVKANSCTDSYGNYNSQSNKVEFEAW